MEVHVIGNEVIPASLNLRPTIPIAVKTKLLKGVDDIKFTKLAIDIIDESSDRGK